MVETSSKNESKKKYNPRATTNLTFNSFRYSDAIWVQIYMIFLTFQRTFEKHQLIFISLHTELNKNLCCFQKTCKTLEKPRDRRRPMNVFFCFPRAEQITRSWPRRQGFSQALLYWFNQSQHFKVESPGCASKGFPQGCCNGSNNPWHIAKNRFASNRC
jgi:hypothetical protein